MEETGRRQDRNGPGNTSGQDGLALEPEAEETTAFEESEIEAAKKNLAEQTARAEDYFQRLVRLQADFENFRRRTAREKEDFYKYAAEQLIESLLPILDNFELALAHGRETPGKLFEGVEIIYRQIVDTLAAQGLTPIPSVGEIFDPSKHEAVLQEQTGNHPDNVILEELRKGYLFKDKLLRPSMVKVARSK
ncbi:MAG: nucleotide exchange factor GrpE [Eubacteriales bacterium]